MKQRQRIIFLCLKDNMFLCWSISIWTVHSRAAANEGPVSDPTDQWEGGQGTDNLDSEHNTTCNGATEQSRWSRSQVLGNKGTFIRLCIYWLVGPDHEHRVHYVECVAWLVSVRSYHQAHSAPTMKTATINHRIEHPDTVCINWTYFIYLVLQWFLHVFLSVYWFHWIW